MLKLLSVLLIGAAVAQNYDEAFTIFIDLDDFLVTQAGNHEFLPSEAIGEHDNVVLHLSESEVKYHQDLHDTHACVHPAEIHEVASFIQEKMYEAPAAPNFIDQVISANYGPSANIWDQLAKGAQANTSPFGTFQPNMFGVAPFQMPPAPQPSESKFQAPSAVTKAPPQAASDAAKPAPAAVSNPVEEEELAVSRFRDAYRAYKLLNRAVDGLVPPPDVSAAATAAAAAAGAPQGAPAPKTSWLDNLMDDDDRRIMGMLSNHPSSPLGGLGDVLKGLTPLAGQSWQPPSRSSNNFDSEIGKIVDEAVKAAFMPPATDATNDLSAQPVTQAQTEDDEHRHHHRHHHHHEENEKAILAPPQEKSEDVSEADIHVLSNILGKLDKSGKVKAAIMEALNEKKDSTPAPVAAPVVETPKVEEPKVESPKVASGSSRPSAPSMTSHIEKAPGPADFIPESVYSQQAVPFKENVQEIVKHVPKRILIPRMEEPGPVIGGSSRPVHITIPPSDIDIKSNTRPAPPSQAQISVSSEITTQVDTTNKGDVSVKASSVAAANDEALTQPEVVIF